MILQKLASKPLRAALALTVGAAFPVAYLAAPTSVSAAAGDLDRAVAALRGISTMTA